MKSSMTFIQSNGWPEIDLILKQKWRRFIWWQVSFNEKKRNRLQLFEKYQYSDDSFIRTRCSLAYRYIRMNEFSDLLNRPLVRNRKSVPSLFVRTSEISWLSEPRLTNHHCISLFSISDPDPCASANCGAGTCVLLSSPPSEGDFGCMCPSGESFDGETCRVSK